MESVAGDKVTVVVEQQSACAGCHAKGLCGEKGAERRITVTTPYAADYSVGESVIVALLKNKMAFSSILWGYVYPLVVLLAALFGAKALEATDAIAALTSIGATLLYYVALYLARRKFDRNIQFTIIKEL